MSFTEKVTLNIIMVMLVVVVGTAVGVNLREYYIEREIIRSCKDDGYKEYVCRLKASGRSPCNSFVKYKNI